MSCLPFPLLQDLVPQALMNFCQNLPLDLPLPVPPAPPYPSPPPFSAPTPPVLHLKGWKASTKSWEGLEALEQQEKGLHQGRALLSTPGNTTTKTTTRSVMIWNTYSGTQVLVERIRKCHSALRELLDQEKDGRSWQMMDTVLMDLLWRQWSVWLRTWSFRWWFICSFFSHSSQLFLLQGFAVPERISVKI